MNLRTLFFTLMAACCLTACSSESHYAPVMDIATIEHVPKNGVYRVSMGETLYSIAWRYGLDYRYLANLNHIAPPYHVVAGQRLYLRGKPQGEFVRVRRPLQQTSSSPHYSSSFEKLNKLFPIVIREANVPVSAWRWPARGPVIGIYSGLNKGINIGGQLGDPVYATAAGQIVYSGSGLRGYGNLIIIKHNSSYLTAYAHNNVIVVKEGQWVKAGQKIAEMGQSGARTVMLHFEIRRNGRPVNPLNYLSRNLPFRG